MTGTGMNSHTAEITNGTYTADIGTTTLKAYCNDSNGFSIYTIGYTNDTYGTTTLIGQSTSNTIVTGTATSAGNPDTSNWAMKLTAVSSPTPTYPITLDNGYGSYSSIPDTYTKVAHRDSGTDIGTNAEGSTLTTTYAAYISRTQPADTYEGKVKYTLVHPANEIPLLPVECASGRICYNPNGGNVVGSMGYQTIPVSGAEDGVSPTSATLLASNFSREGYGFAGWSDAFDYATNQNAHFYGPHEYITFEENQYNGAEGTYNGLSLYAVWIKSQGSLQDSAKVAQLCGTGAGSLTTAPTDGTANLASVSALTDSRDNETYAIAKLADGNCWMIENLRLEADDTTSAEDIALSQGYNPSFIGLATAESSNFDGSTTANSLYSIDGSTAKTIDSTGGSLGYRIPRYNNLNTPANAVNRPQSPNSNLFASDNTTVGMYGYGNYYSWHAIIADTTSYPDGEDYGTTSLCPTGWRLPIGNQSTSANSFGALSVALGGPQDGAVANNNSSPTGTVLSKAFRSYPNNFLYAGYFYNSFAHVRGRYGMYRSSTSFENINGYGLYLYETAVGPGTYKLSKIYGFSVRCTVPASV